MIGYIKGNIEYIGEESIILENNGIGYNIFVSKMFLSNTVNRGEEITVYTYLSVKEDSMTLFGFLTPDECDIFKMLITVNSVGPKAAMSIMSTLDAGELKLAILTGNSKAISASPGIGPKTASKIILDLKDKFDDKDITRTSGDYYGEAYGIDINGDKRNDYDDAVLALTELGYTEREATKSVRGALKELKDDAGVEEIIKYALKNI